MDTLDPILESTSKKRKLRQPGSSSLGATRKHTRVLAACDECRISKTRCDSVRPVCAKCQKKGIPCVYPEKDPFSMYATPPIAMVSSTNTVEKDLNHWVNASLSLLSASRRPSMS
jgi:hypothetical protein